jgi:glucose uptake protein
LTLLLSLVTVLAWGAWIPLAQVIPGVPQRSRTFYACVGNLVLAAGALLAGGGHLSFGWKEFWLPLAGGVVWTGGNYSAFRASETIGLARAAGSWTPLNIVVAFVWGALLFGELNSFSGARFALLGGALVLVLAGVLLIVGSQDRGAPPVPAVATVGTRGDALAHDRTAEAVASDGQPVGPAAMPAPVPAAPSGAAPGRYRAGLLWAAVAGVLWGTYFVPAQWAKVPAQVGNFPLAIGILVCGLALALPVHEPVRLRVKVSAVQLGAGVLFGIGNLTLLGLVARVGTGVGFTIAQLSLLVNASIGIWVFKVPRPGSRAAHVALAGIIVAGSGGAIIGAMR